MNQTLSTRGLPYLILLAALTTFPARLAGETTCGQWGSPAVKAWEGKFTLSGQGKLGVPAGIDILFNETVTGNVSLQPSSNCRFVAVGGSTGAVSGAKVSLNDSGSKTYPSGCVASVSATAGGEAKIDFVSLDFTENTAIFDVGAMTVNGTYVGDVCGAPQTEPFSEIGLDGLPKFSILKVRAPLNKTITFQAPSLLDGASGGLYFEGKFINWTLTLNLTPTLWCKPGDTATVGLPLMNKITNFFAKGGDIDFYPFNVNYTSSGGSAIYMCQADAPGAAIPVWVHQLSPPIQIHMADIIGNRRMTIHDTQDTQDVLKPPGPCDEGFFDIANNCVLNGSSGGRFYAEWESDGFNTKFLGALFDEGLFTISGGPIVLWVSLDGLGTTPQDNPFEVVVQAVETYIYRQLTLNRRIHDYVDWTLIQDPGTVSLAVVDSRGRTTGKLPDGRTTMDIPGSYYLPSDTTPVVVLAPGVANGNVEVLLHGLNTGPYNLAISTGRGASQVPLQNMFSGTISQGANVAYRATINTQMLQQTAVPAAIVPLDLNGDGVVNCADITAVRNAFATRTGQTGFNAWADVDANGIIDTNDLALVTQPLPTGMVCHGVSPATGSGTQQTAMTFSFTDAKGWQDLGVVNILVNNALDGRRACYLAYSRPADALFLINDAGDGGGSFAGSGVLRAAPGSIQNSQCTVSWGSSPVGGSGDVLALTLTVAFKASFAGNKVIYTALRDLADKSSGWQATGVWQISGGTPAITTNVTGMSPGRGNGLTPAVFTFRFSDSKGYQDLGVVNILVNDFLDGRKACYLAYSRPTDTLYLINDGGDGGSSFAGSAVLQKAAGTMQNSQCTVSWGSGPVNGAGNELSLTLTVGFHSAFSGNRIFHLAARDSTDGNNTGWQTLGTWAVQ